MRFTMIGLGLLVTCASLMLVPGPASADRPGASATATVHALDELANCVAQGKCTRTPTPTSSPTSTVTPTATPVAAVATPVDPPTPTPEPALPIPSADSNPFGGYLRPSAGGQPYLELALQQGRWDVAFSAGCAEPPQAWTNAWLVTASDGRPSVGNVRYVAEFDEAWLCPLADASWQSDAPCAQDEDGACDVYSDSSYWDALGRQEASELPAPTDTPAPAPAVAVAATPTSQRVTGPTRSAEPPGAAPAQPEPPMRTVVETVTVVVIATPAMTPTSTPTAVRTATVVATRIVIAVATPSPSPSAVPAAAQHFSTPAPAGHWDWSEFLPRAAVVILALGGVAFVLARRRVVQWRARSASTPTGGFRS